MRYLFADYCLDTQHYALYRAGVPIPLRPKVYQVLAYLLAHRDRVVGKEELLAHVWPGQYVGDAALNSYIMAVRQALGDDGQSQRLVRTVRGRGYRFVVPVTIRALVVPPEEQRPAFPVATAPEPRDLSDPTTAPAMAEPVTGSGVASPVTDGEYKPVTLVCCALTDAPGLAAHLGPEAMHRLMQALFVAAQEVTQHYEGTLTHVTGEGFTMLFGAPLAQEDHARRAVLAALTLRQRLHELPTPGTPHSRRGLALSMGVHTGLAVVGLFPSAPHHLYTAGSATAHLATRLQQRAAPGAILISAATQQLVQEEVQAVPDGTLAIAGSPLPAPVYVVQGLRQRRAGVAGRGTRHQSPFVGRERELALLHAYLAQVAQGQGQVVGIIAAPGMGKSRLLEEFRRSLAGQPVPYHIGHCLPYGQATPYLPVRDLLRQCCGIAEVDSVATITSKVHQCLGERGLAPEDEAPWLLQLLDVPVEATRLAQLDPSGHKAHTFALLHHVILHAARGQPCILAVENLQWIDATSEAWLAPLVERLAGVPLLLLATYRPGYRPLWLGQSVATQVALSGLLPLESLRVVQSVPGPVSLPHHLAHEIVTKAAGNPFFLEELTWSVATHGGRPVALTLPDTVQAVLAARMDRLPSAAKRCLQMAAVIGTEVPVPLLHAIAESSDAALHDSLTHLQTTEFLYEMRAVPTPAYRFKHVLTQEVAYESLLQEQRRALHARIVDAIGRLSPDRLADVASGRSPDQVERLAHHALRGALWDKAVVYSRQAGAKAAARSANREAVAYFEQALGALQHLPEYHDTRELAIDLRLDLYRVLQPLGELRRISDLLHETKTLAEALGERQRLGWVFSFLTNYFVATGDPDRVIEAGQQTLAIAAACDDVGLQVAAHCHLGRVYAWLGNYRQSVDIFRAAVASLSGALRYERLGMTDLPSVICLASLAWGLAELGAFAEGVVCGTEAVRIAEETAHLNSLIVASFGLGHVFLCQGALPKALPVLERGLGVCQAGHVRFFLPWVATHLGYAYTLSGRSAEALPLLEQGVAAATSINNMACHALRVAWLSEAMLRASRLEEARQLAARALRLAHTHQERGHEAWTLRLLGEIAACGAPLQVGLATTHYRQALAVANELGMRPLQAHCHRSLGTLYAHTGQWEQARAALSTAIELYRTMDMTFWLPQTEAALAQVEGQ